jgi:hypothetical protein
MFGDRWLTSAYQNAPALEGRPMLGYAVWGTAVDPEQVQASPPTSGKLRDDAFGASRSGKIQ